MAKTYDRAQVLHVAAQILGREDWNKQVLYEAVYAAKLLIDEVERQCPRPGKPEPTIAPRGRSDG